jgi:hypothetical protein
MGRRQAEALMESTCVITRASTATTVDPATGLLVPVAPTVIYSGKCRLRFPFVRPQQVLAVGQTLAKERGILSIPVTAVGSANVLTDDVAEITESLLDPGSVGQRFRVEGPFSETHATSRRFPVEIVS